MSWKDEVQRAVHAGTNEESNQKAKVVEMSQANRDCYRWLDGGDESRHGGCNATYPLLKCQFEIWKRVMLLTATTARQLIPHVYQYTL